MKIAAIALTGISAGMAGMACAADLALPQTAGYALAPEPAGTWRALDEIRAGGLLFGLDDPPEGQSASVNIELLTSRLPVGGGAWYVPRLHIGGSINTDDAPSHLYAGLTWTVDVTQSVFIEASFGGGIHDGHTGSVPTLGESPLGCSPLFRESASVGFRVTENWSVMATIEHLSNANLCDHNRGITEVGGRIGYRF